MNAATLLLLLLQPVQGPQHVDITRDYVTTADKAYALMPPKPILMPSVTSVQWSGNGRYLLMIRHETPLDRQPMFMPKSNRLEVLVWDRELDKTTKMYEQSGSTMAREAGWLFGSQRAIILVETMVPSGPNNSEPKVRNVLLGFNAGDAQASVLKQSEEEHLDLSFSPKQAIAVLTSDIWTTGTGGRSVERKYSLITTNRNPMPVKLDDRAMVAYDTAGAPALLTFWGPAASAAPGEKIEESYYTIDVATAQAVKKVGRPSLYAEPPVEAGPLMLVQAPHQVIPGQKLKANALVLAGKMESRAPTALVSGDSELYEFSSDRKWIAYTTSGTVFVREVVEVPMSIFDNQMDLYERMGIMSNAKQVGLAMLMFSADNDDMLPGSSDFLEKLYPYTKNRSLFDGFVYTYKGGLLSDLDDPAGTALGHIAGNGGRALVYADGHVKWVADK